MQYHHALDSESNRNAIESDMMYRMEEGICDAGETDGAMALDNFEAVIHAFPRVCRPPRPVANPNPPQLFLWQSNANASLARLWDKPGNKQELRTLSQALQEDMEVLHRECSPAFIAERDVEIMRLHELLSNKNIRIDELTTAIMVKDLEMELLTNDYDEIQQQQECKHIDDRPQLALKLHPDGTPDIDQMMKMHLVQC